MLTILVVDDERNIADGVAYTLNAELGALAEIHVCYGAQSAKEYAAERFIDIIVCDIDMPRQNGLSLCRQLLETNPDLKVVFLTGYSDFSYAYEALKLPDASYVLKLEEDGVLLNAVKGKIAALNEERERREELERGRKLYDSLAARQGEEGADDSAESYEEEGDEDRIIAYVKQYIDAHLGEDLSLTALAERVHYNPAYLSRKFKQDTGENLHSYILDRRLRLAEKLLAESDKFVQDIAAACGFPNPTQFGIAFGKYRGCSPSAFRRKHLK